MTPHPKDAHDLTPGLVNMLRMWQQGLYRWDYIKDLEEGDFPASSGAAQGHHTRPYKREAGGSRLQEGNGTTDAVLGVMSP